MNKIMIRTATAAFALLVASSGLASAQTAPKLPDGCTAVTISRDNIDPSKPEIYLTFRGEGGTVTAIQSCNPPGATNVFGVNPSRTAGARVSLRTKGGSGVVGLPNVYASGDIHNIWCDVVDGNAVFKLYGQEWTGGLKASLKFEDRTAKLGAEVEQHTKGCIASFTPDELAKLKK